MAAPALSAARARPAAARLFVAAAGNHVMREIAEAFARGFAANDVAVEVVADVRPRSDASPDTLQIVVAPHEFYPLFAERAGARDALSTLSSVHVLNVEQPGSRWFEIACWYATRAAGVLDINAMAAAELRRRGLRAVHAPLPYVPAADLDPAPRDVDVAFLGVHSPRREMFLSRHADFFAGRRCRILLARLEAPRLATTPGFVTGEALLRLLARTRVLLNLHAGETPYFEWHRTLAAVASGCAVVSETGDPDPLRPGEDLVIEEADHLVEECRRLLEDEDARRAMVERARARAADRLGAREVCARVLDAVDPGARAPVRAPRRDWGRVLAPARGLAAAAFRGAAPAPSLRPEPAPSRPPAAPPPRATQVTVHERGNDAARRPVAPGVSVLVSVYDYADHVGRAVASACAALIDGIPGGIEVVVVDDGSTDGSADAVEAAMARTKTPVRLLRKSANTGLADTRNLALREARAPYVFVLDADNWIHPRCLAVLHRAIREGAHHAVYGIIAKVDERGAPAGLASFHAWDVRELVRGPYVDAMALFDRAAVLEAGGYADDHPVMGWEDYDLWLRLAAMGKSVALVPEILSAYRVHPASMIHATNRRAEEIARVLGVKFAALAARHPDLPATFGFPRRPPG